MAWLPATLEECLEALGILLHKSGAKPSGTFSSGDSQGELGAATGRCHCVNAEYLGILNILEQEPEARPFPQHPASAQPSLQHPASKSPSPNIPASQHLLPGQYPRNFPKAGTFFYLIRPRLQHIIIIIRTQKRIKFSRIIHQPGLKYFR